MRSTNHTNNPQPTQWSTGLGMFVCVGEIRYGLRSGTIAPKPGMANEFLTKEAGR